MSGPTSLAAFQREMAERLLAPSVDAGWPIAAQPGFAVHRNTAWSGALTALADNHPTVRRLLGDDAFDAVARAHVQRTPPDDGRLVLYGDGFAGTVAAAPMSDAHPWLVDVARLDRAWVLAHVAADAVPLAPADLATLTPAALLAQQLHAHPAAQALHLADPWAYAIWSRHRDGRVAGGDLHLEAADAAHAALVTRPHDHVRGYASEASTRALFAAVEATPGGLSFGAALDRLGEPAVPALAALLAAGALAASAG